MTDERARAEEPGASPEAARPDAVPDAAPDAAPGAVPDAAPDEGADERHLDASAHAHLLSEPLPPDAATETAVLYDVTLTTRAGGAATAAAGPAGASADVPPAEEAGEVEAGAPDEPARHDAADGEDRPPRPAWVRRAAAAGVVALLVGHAALTAYLWVSAVEWRDQARGYLRTSEDLGKDLATTRNQLAGSQAELEAVRAQLATAHQRIVELADEKNQALDDWEITQQLVDYQQRVSKAAGDVALALDQCVQGQQELIGYLQQQAEAGEDAPPYDPEQLAQFETDVEALCQEASEANISLQRELAR